MTKSPPFLYLAPIRGLTDAFFRRTLFRHFGGFDAAVAPFITPQKKSLFGDKMLGDVLPEHNPSLPLIPQLLHTEPEDFLVLAGRLADLGYRQINWNLGCPAPMVAKKRKGSGLLPYPEKIIELLDRVVPRLPVELSLKTRLGYHDPAELKGLLPKLDPYPLQEIIIHARLGKQLYRGSTDPDGFADCLALSRHPLVYNGDITDSVGFALLAARFPTVNRWMLGRGVLANPFLAEEIKGLSSLDEDERKDRLYRFVDDLYHGYHERLSGPGHLLGKLKNLWVYLAASFPGRERLAKKILKCRGVAEYRELVDRLFAG